MNKNLTYDQLIQLAKEHYNNGGDCVFECWDEKTFNEYVENFGVMTKADALDMFKLYETERKEIQAESGWIKELETTDNTDTDTDDYDDFGAFMRKEYGYGDDDYYNDEYDDLWNDRAREVGAI